MLGKIITYSFYLLFFLTPLFWSSKNYELFEYNKMILTYGFTVLIVGSWVLKMIQEKALIFKRTPLDIPLLLFLGANILSTIFSIDPHTSVWGYYSRSNGGLLSIVSYLLLYWALVSNFNKEKVLTLLKFGLASGFIISLWAILEHFGVSFSCVILRGEFNADCWVQDVQSRVFATLGQPNWLAAYLSMLIFPALYFFLTSIQKKQRLLYLGVLLTYYLAFTFTYSRGPSLGLIGGFAVFIISLLDRSPRKEKTQTFRNLSLIVGSCLLLNILFGSALTDFRLVSKFAAPARPAIALPTAPSGTQLENGGTESGQIRLIVWQGAIDIFKHYPIFGSGLETFAYSYYQFRPASHNLTSEWDFLYNKAHNEYINYLATTGIVGITTYLILIGSFIFWSFKHSYKHSNPFLLAIVASVVSYLIYNFFLFSVVIIAVFFYLFPALAFVFTDSLRPVKSMPPFLQIIFKREIYTQVAKGLIILITVYLLYSVFKLWYADTIFAAGNKASDSGNAGRSYNLLVTASDLNPGEPLYRSELAYAAAAASAALAESDATLSGALKDEAVLQMNYVLVHNPKNVSFWRTAIRTYFELGGMDQKYIEETLKALDQAIKLAPTDPKLYYNKALILESEDEQSSSASKNDEALKALQKAAQLKPNYLEVLEKLKEATASSSP